MGSSPRGRGKLCAIRACVREGGLIPARAGKTLKHAQNALLAPAHPRAGGENVVRNDVAGEGRGSSPRGRGKLVLNRVHVTCLRLIPARAGKTLSDLRFYRADRSDLGNP